MFLPFGHGAERTLANKNLGAALHGLNLNTHDRSHVLRAGNANMFLSPLFAEVFATVTGATVELYDTDLSQGAARGVGASLYHNFEEAFVGLRAIKKSFPINKLPPLIKTRTQNGCGACKRNYCKRNPDEPEPKNFLLTKVKSNLVSVSFSGRMALFKERKGNI